MSKRNRQIRDLILNSLFLLNITFLQQSLSNFKPVRNKSVMDRKQGGIQIFVFFFSVFFFDVHGL